jgi:hypothetical protein
MHFPGWARGFHIRLNKPPARALRPINPNNACTPRITAAAGTELAGASFQGTVKCGRYWHPHISFPATELYDPKAFFTHAASLRQAFAHCAKFPTAASRRSLDRVSVPVWLTVLSDQLPVVALVGHYPANKLIGRGPILKRQLASEAAFSRDPEGSCAYPVLAPLSRCYSGFQGRLSTRYSPVRH